MKRFAIPVCASALVLLAAVPAKADDINATGAVWEAIGFLLLMALAVCRHCGHEFPRPDEPQPLRRIS